LLTKGEALTPKLTSTLQLGDPIEHRGISITPLFPTADPLCAYMTLDQALPMGLAITETSLAGSVPELAVSNPLDQNVLLYDGEELVGAKQNRILNVTVLVGAKTSLPIPVSCVEEGRWSSRSAFFDAASHVSHANLRRRKAESLAARPLARGIAQAEVWDEVSAKAARMGVDSHTRANQDTFEAHRASLVELEQAFPLERGQCGAVLALGDNLCLDFVSRPDAFEQLWPKLRRGYLLDALEILDRPATARSVVEAFAAQVSSCPPARQQSAGLGEDVRLRGAGVIGSGLELDSELIQLSAFTSRGGSKQAFGRIARPSRRR
jgi:hypothetical protein